MGSEMCIRDRLGVFGPCRGHRAIALDVVVRAYGQRRLLAVDAALDVDLACCGIGDGGIC